MLTNNKKRGFVKFLALTLAALMVFSVCLTGCTDQDARDQAADALNKAESAQTAADAAQTADEVAAAITKALEGYYKGSADDIKAIVAAELAGVATADDLAAYAEDLDALTAKVNELTTGLTEAQVEALLNEALFNVAIDKKISDAIAGAGILSAEDVKALIDEALDAFNITLKDELDDYVTEDELAEYFGDKTPVEIYEALDTMIEEFPGEHLDAESWNKVTEDVILTLQMAAELVEEVQGHFYLDESKYAINTYSGIKMFPSTDKGADKTEYTADDQYGEYDAALAEDALGIVGLLILRAPDAATIAAIKAGFEAALAVECWCDEAKGIRDDLYGLGNLVQVDQDKDGTVDDNDDEKYKSDKGLYHGVEYAKGANKVYQVVTDANKADFATIAAAMDARLVRYAADLEHITVAADRFPFGLNDIHVLYQLKKTDGTVLGNYLAKATDYKGNTYSGAATADAKTLDADAASATVVGYTVIFAGLDETNVKNWAAKGYDAIRATAFDYAAPQAGKYMAGYFDNINDAAKGFVEPAIKVDKAGYTVTGNLVAALAMANVANDVAVAETYAAIIKMLADVDAAMKDAQDTFYAFLKNIETQTEASAPAANSALKADSYYEQNLKDYMCIHDNLDGTITIPTNKVDWTTVAVLLEEVLQTFNYAENIRGNVTEGLYQYDLYIKLKNRAADLLFEPYRVKALDVLNVMMNDYITAVQAAVEALGDSATDASGYGSDAAQTLSLTTANGWAEGEKWSKNFVEVFYTGKNADNNNENKFSWYLGTQNQPLLALNLFTENNSTAMIPAIKADGSAVEGVAVACDILKVLADNATDIKQELTAATIGPRVDILTADVDDLADGADVTKAFDAYLDTAKANLDEIIYRWTFNEIKDGVLNSLYALVSGDVTFDTFFTAGIADFYNDGVNDAGYKDAIKKALQNYLTGWAAVDSTSAMTETTVTNATTNVTTITNIAAPAGVAVAVNNLAGKTLPAGLVSPDKANPVMTYAATAKVAEVLALRTAAVLDMENIAIKLRFDDYLEEARSALWFTYHAYKISPAGANYAMSNAITDAYNNAANEIAGIEYKAHTLGQKDLSVYKQAYIALLHIVIASDSTYYPLIDDATKAGYDAWIAAAKSYGKTAYDETTNPTGYHNLIQPVAPYTNAAEYYAAGSAINTFDEIANANAYKDGANDTKDYLY